MRCRYKLVGPRTGESGRFGMYVFKDGYSHWADKPAEDWAGADRQMVRFYSCEREHEENLDGDAEGSRQTEVLETGGAAEAEASAESDGAGEAETGETEHQADEAGGSERAENAVTLIDAIDTLRHDNDEHWTPAGLASLTYLRRLTGQKITRAEVERAARWVTRGHLAANAAEQR